MYSGQLNDVTRLLDPSPKTARTGLKASQNTELNQYHLSGFHTTHGFIKRERVVSVRIYRARTDIKRVPGDLFVRSWVQSSRLENKSRVLRA